MTKKLIIALVSCFATAALAAGCERPEEQRIEESFEQREEALEHGYEEDKQRLENEEEELKRKADDALDHDRQVTPPLGE